MKSWRSSTYLLLTFFQTITSNLPFAPPEVQQCRKNMPDFCTLDQQRQISKNTHLITVKKQAMTIADCECCLRLRITENNGKNLSQNSVFIQNITFFSFFLFIDYLYENFLMLGNGEAKTFDFYSFILKDFEPGAFKAGPNQIGCIPDTLFGKRLKYVVTKHSACIFIGYTQ